MGDNIYININITNPGTGNVQGQVKQARTNISYDQPIVPKADDYTCAIVKYSIPLQDLPLFHMPIKPNQANSNLTTFVVGVCQEEDRALLPNPPLTPGFEAPVIWETQNWGTPVPVQNQPVQVITEYYDCYSYKHLIYLVNLALSNAWVAAGSPGAYAGTDILAFGTGTPYFVYDSKSKLINLIMPMNFVENGDVASPIKWKVYVNDNLGYFFQAFDYEINRNRFEIATHSLRSNSSYIALHPYRENTLDAAARVLTETQYIIESEYPANEYINSIRKIVFVSNSLPIAKENFPAPYAGESGQVSYLGVMTDFNIDGTNTSGFQRSILTYESILYRMIDLNTSAPIRNFDFAVYWADNNNNLFPINIGNLDAVSIKLGFFKKPYLQLTPKI